MGLSEVVISNMYLINEGKIQMLNMGLAPSLPVHGRYIEELETTARRQKLWRREGDGENLAVDGDAKSAASS